MQFKEMRSDLQSRLGDIGQTKFTDLELGHWLNMAQQDVANRLDDATGRWFCSLADIALVMNQDAYELPTDVRRIKAVSVKPAAEGKYVQAMETDVEKLGALDKNSFYTPSATQPFWYQVGKKIYILPAPSAAVETGLRVLYLKRLPLLVGDTDETEVPLEYQNLIILRAQIIAAGKFNQPTDVLIAQYNAEFENIRAMYENGLKIAMIGESKLAGVGQ